MYADAIQGMRPCRSTEDRRELHLGHLIPLNSLQNCNQMLLLYFILFFSFFFSPPQSSLVDPKQAPQ
jgi:hypothetical protein